MSARSESTGEEPEKVRIDPPTDFPPQEDGYERLWTPQRMSYVLGKGTKNSAALGTAPADRAAEASKETEVRRDTAATVAGRESGCDARDGRSGGNRGAGDRSAFRPGCPFCEGPRKSDEDALICWRGTYVFAVLNLYPYNTGHLMICPYRHVPYITDLTDDELFEFEKATTLAMTVMRNVSHPDGWNIGINQGAVAGAGVADHLHQHVVPRWEGDANFMPIIAQTKTMPVLLGNQRDAYAAEFGRLAPSFGLPLTAQKPGKSA